MANDMNVGSISVQFRAHKDLLKSDLEEIKGEIQKSLSKSLKIDIAGGDFKGSLNTLTQSINDASININKALKSIATQAQSVVDSVSTSMEQLAKISDTKLASAGDKALKTSKRNSKKQLSQIKSSQSEMSALNEEYNDKQLKLKWLESPRTKKELQKDINTNEKAQKDLFNKIKKGKDGELKYTEKQQQEMNRLIKDGVQLKQEMMAKEVTLGKAPGISKELSKDYDTKYLRQRLKEIETLKDKDQKTTNKSTKEKSKTTEKTTKETTSPQQQALLQIQSTADKVYKNILGFARQTYDTITQLAQGTAGAQQQALQNLNIKPATEIDATPKTTKATKETQKPVVSDLKKMVENIPPIKLHFDEAHFAGELGKLKTKMQETLGTPVKVQTQPAGGAKGETPSGAPSAKNVEQQVGFYKKSFNEFVAGSTDARIAYEQNLKMMADGTVKSMINIRDAHKMGIMGLLDFSSMAQKIIHYITFSIGVQLVMTVRQAFSSMISAIIDFEKSAYETASVAGYLGASFDDAVKSIMNLSSEIGEKTRYSANIAASALYNLASAGIDVVKKDFEDLIPIINYAAATNSELDTAFQAVTKAMKQFGLQTEDTEALVDSFMGTITSSYATLDKLVESYKYVGSIAGELGQDFNELNATLGVLYDRGLEAGQAGQRLNMIYTKLLKPTDDSTEVLDKMGLSLSDINPYANSLTDIFYKLRAAQFDAADAATFFRARTAAAALILIDEVDAIARARNQLELTGGLTESIAEKQLSTMNSQLKLMGNQMEEAALSLRDAIIPALHWFASTITQEVVPSMKSLYGGIGFIGDGLKGLVVIINPFISSIFAVVPAFASFSIALAATGLAMRKLGYDSAAASIGLTTLKTTLHGTLSSLLLFALPLTIIAESFEGLRGPIYFIIGALTVLSIAHRVAAMYAMNEHRSILDLIGAKIKEIAVSKIQTAQLMFGQALRKEEIKTYLGTAAAMEIENEAMTHNIASQVTANRMRRAGFKNTEIDQALRLANVSTIQTETGALSIHSNVQAKDVINKNLSTVATVGQTTVTRKHTLATIASTLATVTHGIATKISGKIMKVWNLIVKTSTGLTNTLALGIQGMTLSITGSTISMKAATVAAKALKIALVSIGVGAAMFALTAIMENWDGITKAVGNAFESFKQFIGISREELALDRQRARELVSYRKTLTDISNLEVQRVRITEDIVKMQVKGVESAEEYSSAMKRLGEIENDIADNRTKFLETGQGIINWLKSTSESLDKSIIAYIDMDEAEYKLNQNRENQVKTLDEVNNALNEYLIAQRQYGDTSEEASIALENYESLNRRYMELQIENSDLVTDLDEKTKTYTTSMSDLSSVEKKRLNVAQDIYETNQLIISQQEELAELRARHAHLLNVEANWTEMFEANTKDLWEQMLKLLEAEEKLYKLRQEQPKRLDELFQALAEYGLVNDEIIDGYKEMKIAEAELFKSRIAYFNVMDDLSENERKRVEEAQEYYKELRDEGVDAATAFDIAFGSLNIPSLDSSELHILADFAEKEYMFEVNTDAFEGIVEPIVEAMEAFETLPEKIMAAWTDVESLPLEINVELLVKEDIEDELKSTYTDLVPLFTSLWDIHAPTLEFPGFLPPDLSSIEDLNIQNVVSNLIGDELELTPELLINLGVEGDTDAISTLQILDNVIDSWSQNGLQDAQIIDLVVYGAEEVWDTNLALRNLRANIPEVNSVISMYASNLDFLNTMYGEGKDQVEDFTAQQIIAATLITTAASRFGVDIKKGMSLENILALPDMSNLGTLDDVLSSVGTNLSDIRDTTGLDEVATKIGTLTESLGGEDGLISKLDELITLLSQEYGFDLSASEAIGTIEDINAELETSLSEAGFPTADNPQLAKFFKPGLLGNVYDWITNTHTFTFDTSAAITASDNAKKSLEDLWDEIDKLPAEERTKVILEIETYFNNKASSTPSFWDNLQQSFADIFPGLFGHIQYGDENYIPKAKGGITTSPQQAIIGEDGAEAVIPLEGSNRKYGKNILQQIIPRYFPDLAMMAEGGVVGIGDNGETGLNKSTLFDDMLSTLKDIYTILKDNIEGILTGISGGEIGEEPVYTPRMGISVPVTSTTTEEGGTGALGASADIRQGGKVVNVNIYVDANDFNNAILSFIQGSTDAVSMMSGTLSEASSAFKGLVDSAGIEFYSNTSSVSTSISDSGTFLATSAKVGGILLFQKVISAADTFAKKVRNIRVSVTVRQNAQGGIYSSPTLGMFGEAGAEAIIPLEGSNRKYGEQLLKHIIPEYYPDLMFQQGALFTGGGQQQIANEENYNENYNVLGPVYVQANNTEELAKSLKYKYRSSSR